MSVSKRRRPGEGAMGAVEHVWVSDRINTAYGMVIALCTRTLLPYLARLHDGKLQSRSSGDFGVSVSQAVVVPQDSSYYSFLSSAGVLFCTTYSQVTLCSPIVIRVCQVHAGRAHRNYASDCPVRAVARSRPTASRQWIQCGPASYLAVVLVTRSACPYPISCIKLTLFALGASRLDRSPNSSRQSINEEIESASLGSFAGALQGVLSCRCLSSCTR
jgi:hypothetical protein